MSDRLPALPTPFVVCVYSVTRSVFSAVRLLCLGGLALHVLAFSLVGVGFRDLGSSLFSRLHECVCVMCEQLACVDLCVNDEETLIFLGPIKCNIAFRAPE